jgi:hypothetical protein
MYEVLIIDRELITVDNILKWNIFIPKCLKNLSKNSDESSN